MSDHVFLETQHLLYLVQTIDSITRFVTTLALIGQCSWNSCVKQCAHHIPTSELYMADVFLGKFTKMRKEEYIDMWKKIATRSKNDISTFVTNGRRREGIWPKGFEIIATETIFLLMT